MDFVNFFDGIVNGISANLEQKVTGRRMMALQTAKLGRQIFSGEEPMIWVNVSVPFEIINCFPIASIYSEFVGAVLAGADLAPPYIEKAEAAGYTTDLCSYHRSLLGASLQSLLPKPIAAVACSYPCDGGIKSVGEVARLADVDMFLIQVPAESTDENVAYLAGQFEKMTEFLAEKTGHPFDRDRLKQIILRSNQTADLMRQLYAYARYTPAPYDHKDLKNFQIVMLPMMGTDEGIEVVQAFLDEFGQRIETGNLPMPDERIRLLWIQNRIQFSNDLLEIIAERYRANIVWDELNEVFWDPIDPDHPFPGLARRLIDAPLSGNLQKRIDTLTARSVQYKIDGAIHPCHWGCRQSLNARSLFSNALEKIGVPTITLDVDCVDKRSFSQGQLVTRLEAFCEMLKS